MHAVSGRYVVVRQDKTLKLSSNPIEASSFELYNNLNIRKE